MFKAISYLVEKLGQEKAYALLNRIEEDFGINGYDNFMSLGSKEEVEEFISENY
jgi:hypothetical protein